MSAHTGRGLDVKSSRENESTSAVPVFMATMHHFKCKCELVRHTEHPCENTLTLTEQTK